jgi:phosphatidylglycerophosphatase A
MPDEAAQRAPGKTGKAGDAWLRLAASLGVGLLPGPAGTYGSLLTWALAGAWLAGGGPALAGPWYGLALLAAAGLALAVSEAALRRRVFGPGHDPGQIVIDEMAGQLVALYGVGSLGWDFVAGLLAFRLFDIAKPWPVNVSQGLPGGWGVVVDDLLAGLYALGLVRLAVLCSTWPGW